MAEISRDVVKVTMAAMPPLFWYKAETNQCVEVMNSTVPMGTRLFSPNKPLEIQWKINDVLVLFSDGLPERSNHEDVDLGFEKIEEHILNNAHLPPDEILASLIKLGDDHAVGKDTDDDITVMVLKKKS